MSKSWVNIKKMPLGKKIYALLWFGSGLFLITLIILLVVLKDQSAATNPDGKWSYNLDANKLAAIPDGKNIGNIDTIPVKLKPGASSPTPSPSSLTLGGVQSIADAPKLYEIDETFNFGVYSFGTFQASPTSDALNAQNAIAAIGMLFGLALTCSIFTTVIVEVRLRKVKTYDKNATSS